jgi:hypothetical protein
MDLSHSSHTSQLERYQATLTISAVASTDHVEESDDDKPHISAMAEQDKRGSQLAMLDVRIARVAYAVASVPQVQAI